MKPGIGMWGKVWLAGLAVCCALLFIKSSLAVPSLDTYELQRAVVNAAGNTREGSGKRIIDSCAEAGVGRSFGNIYAVSGGFFVGNFMPFSTPTVTPTVVRNFGGALLDEHYVYAAPNPMRGSTGHISFELAAPAEVTIKIFTASNSFVISQHWSQLPAGANRWDWNTANLANGVYLMWIRAKSWDGQTTTVIKKLALVK